MRYLLILLVGLTVSSVNAQNKLVKQKIEKEIELKVPNNFTPLNQTEIVSKYLTNSTPMAVFGDERRIADLSISKLPTRWTVKDSEILKDFYKASILSTYTKVQFFKEEVAEINGQKFIVFEFLSSFKDENSNALTTVKSVKKYTYLLYGLRAGSQYVFNFSSPAADKNLWSKTADKVMNSIKFL